MHNLALTANFTAGHTFRRSTAGAFGPDLSKKLAQLVKMEKNVMRSMELVARERMEVAVSLLPSAFYMYAGWYSHHLVAVIVLL